MHSPRAHPAAGPPRRRPTHPPPPQTDGAATDDDAFDAPTTEAQTDWNTTGIEGVEGRDYSVSVSGYRNYVTEMERMLGGDVDVHLDTLPTPPSPPPPPPPAPRPFVGESSRRKEREVRYPPESVHGTEPSESGRRPGLGSYASVDNARHVTGRRGRVELVEHKIMEDGPERTISLWRERVAASGDGSSRYGDESNRAESTYGGGGRSQRRVSAAEVYHGSRQEVRHTNRSRGGEQLVGSYIPVRSKEISRESNGGYERTEVSVRQRRAARGKKKKSSVSTKALSSAVSSQFSVCVSLDAVFFPMCSIWSLTTNPPAVRVNCPGTCTRCLRA